MSFHWALVPLPLVSVFLVGAVYPPSETVIVPVFQPPNWVFPVAWTYITLALGYVTSYYQNIVEANQRTVIFAFYSVILSGLIGWLPINYYKYYKVGLATLVATCWASITYLVYLASLGSSNQVWLLLPLPFWLVVACCLNGVVLQESIN